MHSKKSKVKFYEFEDLAEHERCRVKYDILEGNMMGYIYNGIEPPFIDPDSDAFKKYLKTLKYYEVCTYLGTDGKTEVIKYGHIQK